MQDDAVVTCLRCGKRNSSLVSHCYYCGNRLESTCSHCGHLNPPEVKYHCDSCGQPFNGSKKEKSIESNESDQDSGQPPLGVTEETMLKPSETAPGFEQPSNQSETESTPERSSPVPDSERPSIGDEKETTSGPPSSAPDTGPIACPRCQHSNEPASSYCYNCGLPLDGESVPASASTIRAFQQGTPGGFWVRFLANILDTILVTVANFVIYGLFGEDFAKAFDPDAPFNFADLVSTVVGVLYAPILISLYSTTVGKRPFDLYVVRVDGGRCSFWRAFGRELAKFISAIILFVGFFMIAFRKDKRGLHDLIAGTVVVKRSDSA